MEAVRTLGVGQRGKHRFFLHRRLFFIPFWMIFHARYPLDVPDLQDFQCAHTAGRSNDGFVTDPFSKQRSTNR